MTGNWHKMNVLLSFADDSSRGVAGLATLFSAVMLVFVAAAYVQGVVRDPLNDPALADLRAQFARDSGNSLLKSQVRAADLQARRCFFVNQVRLRIGSLLLLGGAATALVAFKIRSELGRSVPDVSALGARNAIFGEAALGRSAIAVAGLVIALAALAAWIASGRITPPLPGEASGWLSVWP